MHEWEIFYRQKAPHWAPQKFLLAKIILELLRSNFKANAKIEKIIYAEYLHLKYHVAREPRWAPLKINIDSRLKNDFTDKRTHMGRHTRSSLQKSSTFSSLFKSNNKI